MAVHPNDRFELAATGDAMITRELRPYRGGSEEFDELWSLLEGADATSTNLEVLIHDYQEGVHTTGSTGTYMRAPPEALDELAAMGVDLYAASTNHSFDYGHGGMLSTMAELEARDLTYAGLGRSLFEARRPGYEETPGGRVALLSACARFDSGSAAKPQSAAMPGSPGINPLGRDRVYHLPEPYMDDLEEISRVLNIEEIKAEWRERGHYGGRDWLDEEYFHLMDMKFRPVADESEAGIYFDLNEDDAEAVLEWVGEADRTADYVVVGVHYHDSALGYHNKQTTPEFMQAFAKRCVDAGADAFVGTGPHRVRGIEVYEGRPIFYSLGNFIDQRESIERFPPDIYDRHGIEDHTKPSKVFDGRWTDEDGNPKGDLIDPRWWQTVVPVCTFEAGELSSLEIHPVSLQRDAGRPHRGVPVRAHGEEADDILDNLGELSAEFGTEIEREGETGVVRV